MKKLVLLLLLVSISNLYAQKRASANIQYKNGETKQLDEASLMYDSSHYIIGIKTKNEDISTLNTISNISFDNENFIVKNEKESYYLCEKIISGNVSLYQSGEHYFLENEEHGFREIEKKVDDGLTLKTFNYAKLTLYINKCKEAQDYAFRHYHSIPLNRLTTIIEMNNECRLSEDIQFATEVVEKVNAKKEVIEYAVSVGYNFLDMDFNDLSQNVSNSSGSPVIGAQVYFNTNMLKKGLSFLAMVDYTLPVDYNSSDNGIYLKTETGYVSAMLGVRYTFKNISETFSPYIGGNTGILFNSMSSLTKQSNVLGSRILDFNTTNEVAYNFNIGTYIHLGNQKIDFNLLYLPKINFSSKSTNTGTRIDSYTSVTGFQLKASYVF